MSETNNATFKYCDYHDDNQCCIALVVLIVLDNNELILTFHLFKKIFVDVY